MDGTGWYGLMNEESVRMSYTRKAWMQPIHAPLCPSMPPSVPQSTGPHIWPDAFDSPKRPEGRHLAGGTRGGDGQAALAAAAGRGAGGAADALGKDDVVELSGGVGARVGCVERDHKGDVGLCASTRQVYGWWKQLTASSVAPATGPPGVPCTMVCVLCVYVCLRGVGGGGTNI